MSNFNKEQWLIGIKNKFPNIDFSYYEYINAHTPSKIYCSEIDELGRIHGFSEVAPMTLNNGKYGCPKCSPNAKIDTDIFKYRSRITHNDYYIYDENTKYTDPQTDVIIKCPIHGYFKQLPYVHMNGGGCPKCNGGIAYTVADFIKKGKEIHYNEYDYSKVRYINWNTKVCIICPKHGEFWMTPNNHLQGQKCPKCQHRVSLTFEEFIDIANDIHRGRYKYVKENNIVKAIDKVKAICPVHGEFKISVNKHLSQRNGCPKCHNIFKLEQKLCILFDKHKIKYIFHCNKYTLPWLNRQSLDFYLPCYNIAIECQGEQHFHPIKHFGGVEGYIKRTERDMLKINKCDNHNITLIFFTTKELMKRVKNTDLLFFDEENGILSFISSKTT